MVGDWPERDLDGAKNVGMKTAFARYGASSFNEQQYNSADIALNNINEILDYITMENN
jgi:putative hydrolase of the HAD superfamily